MIEDKLTKLEIITILFSLIFGVIGFFYVRNALDGSRIELTQENKEKPNVKEIKPAVGFVYLNDGTEIKQYRLRRDNANSMYEIIEELYSQGDLTYEVVSYTFGEKITKINGIEDESQGLQDKDSLSDSNKNWRIYMQLVERDVENQIEDLLLDEDEAQLLRSAIGEKKEITFQIKDVSFVHNGEYFIEYR